MRFVDTNILLYSISTEPSEERKREIANRILYEADLALSVQVLQEFYVQATRPTREQPLSHAQAADLVTAFSRFPVAETTLQLVETAMATRDRFQLSYWDAAIVEAARVLGCDQVLSEDMSHGKDYDGVVVTNPFS